MVRDVEKYEEVENRLITSYRKKIWSRFVKGVKEFDLIQEGDKVAVCMSGGKDSFLLAKCMQELQKHGNISFELVFIVMDPGYKIENRKLIEENAKNLNIPIHIFESNIFEVVTEIKDSPCYLCARMRRGCLYGEAKKLGCNKIALGHHFDDVIETILMSMLYGGEVKTMMPKLHSTNFENMELIRPLYYVKEESIIAWRNYHNLKFLNCACKFTEMASNHEIESKRKEMKDLIVSLREKNPFVDNNILKSVYNINLNTIIGYHRGEDKYHFLDDYDR